MKKRPVEPDDGRVIANMNLEGMRCYRPGKRRAFDEFGCTAVSSESAKPTKREIRELARGGALALLTYGACIFGGLAVLMLLYLR